MDVNPVQLILAKRNGESLPSSDLRALVLAYTAGDVPDYQMSAFLMAAYFQGMDERETAALTDAMQWAGLMWRGICPWDKGQGSRAPHKGYARHQAEYIAWATNGPCRVAEHGGPWPGVYRHTVKQSDKHHMAGKPTPLLAELCQWVPDGATILDPFMGSGTTGVAAIQTGRRFVGVEIDPGHFTTACQRIEQAIADLGLEASAA
jgi:site-specific DNA-methyltransferase (adenine-specific)